MRDREHWAPSKVIWNARHGGYRANPASVRPGSLLVVNRMMAVFEPLLRTHARGRLLDCGCGEVPYYELYREQTSEVVCIDWGETPHGGRHVDRQVDLNRPLPFEPARFDSVLLADVLEHVAEPAALMREIGRVLAPGGALIASVPFLYRVHEQPHDYYRYTRYALERLCREASLEPVVLEAYGGYPDVLGDLLHKGLAPLVSLRGALLSLSSWLLGTGVAERFRARTAEEYPLGYCLVAIKRSG